MTALSLAGSFVLMATPPFRPHVFLRVHVFSSPEANTDPTLRGGMVAPLLPRIGHLSRPLIVLAASCLN